MSSCRGSERTASSPGAASARRRLPPCSCATACTSARPSPEPGRVARRLAAEEALGRPRTVRRRNARALIGHRDLDPCVRRRGRQPSRRCRTARISPRCRPDWRPPAGSAPGRHRPAAACGASTASAIPRSSATAPYSSATSASSGASRTGRRRSGATRPRSRRCAAAPGTPRRCRPGRPSPARSRRAARLAVSACSAASSSRARARVIGVRRSWAMALDTWRTPVHQPADAVQHVVDRLGELVELVAAAGQPHALGEVAGRDRRGGGRDVGQRAAEQAAHHQRADGRHRQHHRAAPTAARRSAACAAARAPARRARPADGSRPAGRSAAPAPASGCRRARPAARTSAASRVTPCGQCSQVAGDAAACWIDQQVDRVVLDVLRQPVLDGQHQRRQAALGPAFGQALRVGAGSPPRSAGRAGRRSPTTGTAPAPPR